MGIAAPDDRVDRDGVAVTAPARRDRRVAELLGAAAVVIALSGCAPQISSPVGVWKATGQDEGTLVINADGTFEAEGVSYDLIHDRDTDSDFSAEGIWRLVRGGSEIKLHFTAARRGRLDVDPASFSTDFTSGAMRFADPDETVGIELRIQPRDE